MVWALYRSSALPFHIIQSAFTEKSMNKSTTKSNGAKGKGQRKDQEVNEALPKEKGIKKANNVGRPSKKNKKSAKNQQQQHQLSPISHQQATQALQLPNRSIQLTVMNVFVDFFDKANQKRGFVFKKDERKKMQRETGQKWEQEAQWKTQIEKAKIRHILSCRNLTEEESEKISKVMEETSAIHSQEFTNEYYAILLQIYEAVLAQKAQGLNDLAPFLELGDSIFFNKDGIYRFFSFKFRQKVLSLKDGFMKPTDPEIHRTLVVNVKNELSKL